MAALPLPGPNVPFVNKDGTPTPVFYTWLQAQASALATVVAEEAAEAAAWATFTPTAASTAGTITAYTATGRFIQIGSVVFFWVQVSVTNNGTGGTGFLVTLTGIPAPLQAENAVVGFDDFNDVTLQGQLFSNLTMLVRDYIGDYPASTGSVLILNGFYETAA